MARRSSSLMPLALLYAALIVYASLYPFSGWRPASVDPLAFLSLPWPKWWTRFDLVSNLLGYMPLGALLCGGLLRSGWRRWAAALFSLAVGTALSGSMEYLQNHLPARVPSNVDLGLNMLGTLAGVLAALLAHQLGMMNRWQSLRERWLLPQTAFGVALLLLWPIALLFPAPVPFGLGHVAARLQELLAEALEQTPLEGWITANPAVNLPQLSPALELVTISLGLLAPCLLAYSITPVHWRRVLMVAGGAALGFGATTLSTALSFGPQHALTWVTVPTPIGLGVGAASAVVLALLPPRAAAAVGLMMVTALVALVNRAPADPYFASSLLAWEQGRFIRFHGLAQWIGWLWPYVVLGYLLARTLAPEQRR